MSADAEEFTHRAFLVFAKADTEQAGKVQRALAAIAIPRDLVGKDAAAGPVPEKIEAIYRYGEAGPEVEALTEPAAKALAKSQFLVVLCSPAGAQSGPVSEAVRRFKLMGRHGRIVSFILAGEPEDRESGCFPASLRYRLTAQGTLSSEPEDPVAAVVVDARPGGADNSEAVRKLAAALLGVTEIELPLPPPLPAVSPPEAPAALPVPVQPVSVPPPEQAAPLQPPEPAPLTVAVAPAAADEAAGRTSGEAPMPVAEAPAIIVPARSVEPITAAALAPPVTATAAALAQPITAPEPFEPAPLASPAHAPRRRRSRLGMGLMAVLLLVGVLAGAWLWERQRLASDPVLLDQTLESGTATAVQTIDFAQSSGLPRAALGGLADASEAVLRHLAELGPDTALLRYRQAAMYLALAREDEAIGRPNVARQRTAMATTLLEKVKPQDLRDAGHAREVALAQLSVGTELLNRGAPREALALVQPSHETLKRRQAAQPDNRESARDLSRAAIALGDAELARGQPDAALPHYQEALSLRDKLAAQEPNGAAARPDLSVAHERIGDVRAAKGDSEEALKSYRTSLALRLAAVDPDSSREWQRQLSVSFNKIGDMLVERNAQEEALNNYRAGLALQLAAARAGDNAAQRDLSVSYERIGDLLRLERNWEEALAAYRKSLAIRERLASSDSTNQRWARDLSVSYERIGDVMLARGALEDAIAAYRTSLSMRERLYSRDSNNLVAARDVAVSQNKLGDALMAKSKTKDAVKSYRAALTIREKLAAAAPKDGQLQWDLLVLQWRLASTGDDAAKRFGMIVTTLRDLDAQRKLTIEQARWLPAAEQELARARASQ